MVIAVAVDGCAAHVSPPGAVSPDRPGYTDTPPALPKGAFQLEAGISNDQVGTGNPVTYTTLGETLLRIGVGAQSELRLFGNSYATRSISGGTREHGMEDPKLGIKTTLHTKPDSIHSFLPSVAALVATTLPMGATQFRAAHAQPEVKLAMNWTTASPFSLYSNLGIGRIYNEVGRADRAWASVAGWWSVNPKISVFAEGMQIGRLRGSGSGTAGSFADGGITYLINDRLQLDARVGHGVGSQTSTERFVGVGLARRW